jgi:hypothetical protein
MFTTTEPEPGAAIVAGASVAVKPAGAPETVRATAELKPLRRAEVMPTCEVFPIMAVTEVALGVSVNVGVGTTTDTLTLAVWPPPTPVTVIAYVPGITVEAAVTFKVDAPEPGEAIVGDEKVAIIPVGIPVTVNATADFRVALAVEVIVTGTVLPTATVRVLEDALNDSVAATPFVTSLQW